jgi:hypothetical protein
MKKLIIPVILGLTLSAPAFAYICGDANGDQSVNVADAVYLVNYIFKGGPAPDPVEAGDANLDEQVNIGDAVYLINFIFRGGPEPCPVPGGGMTGHSGCKGPYKNPDTLSLDCIQYEYDGMGTLNLTHINGAFNCCPEEILVDINVQGNTIYISEDETFGPEGACACLCLFDVYITITGLMPGTYTIIVDGMYLYAMPPLNTTVDLVAQPSGEFCLERDDYPWVEF